MWYVCDVVYAVLYVRDSCFVVRGCAASKRCIDVCCKCDVFNIVNVYLYNLTFCVVCIKGRRYVCCSECNVISNECEEPIPCLVQPIGAHGGKVVYFRGELGFLNCDYISMCVVISSLSSSILFLIPFMLTCSMMRFLSILLLGVCACVMYVVMGSSLVCL